MPRVSLGAYSCYMKHYSSCMLIPFQMYAAFKQENEIRNNQQYNGKIIHNGATFLHIVHVDMSSKPSTAEPTDN